MSSLSYRPDIDGLRAMAVIAVILYHAGVPYAGGGYIGVDVFFVISGFLITSLIMKDKEQGTFTFAGFWERRARRILPALVTMIAATLVAGWFLFLPVDYAALGKQTAAQAVFGSNILFYKESGYFDSEAFLKPLLHTWSLAVEEQFYIFYPLGLYLLWRYTRFKLSSFILLGAGVSFALCLAMMEINPRLAFYMLPFRAWELLVGALIACYGQKLPRYQGKTNQMIALTGLAAIFAPVYLYDSKTTFPGLAALFPVLGTALLIYVHANAATFVSKALTLRPVVFVGLVSYSWYLWHWPVMVFTRYMPWVEYTQTVALLCAALSFIPAVLSWKFIETPFRKKIFLPRRRVLLTTSVAMLVLFTACGGVLFYSNGLAQRLPEDVARYSAGVNDFNQRREQCDKTSVEKINRDEVCNTLDVKIAPEFILWGDSQADAIAPVFFTLSQKYGRNGYVVTHHGCESIIGFHKKSWDPRYPCKEFNKAVFDLIKRHKIKHVFLISGYNSWMAANYLDPGNVTLEGEYPQGYKTILGAGLARTVDLLRKEGAQVYFMYDVPSATFDVPRLKALDKLYGLNVDRGAMSRKSYLGSREAQTKPFLDKYGKNKITVLDPADILCKEEQCIYEHDGFSLYYNKTHLSTHGAEYLMPLFEPYFKKGF